MPPTLEKVSVSVEAVIEEQPAHLLSADNPDVRILICGDFSGRGNSQLHQPLSSRRPVRIDLDNWDRVMRHLRPELRVAGLSLHFAEMDDFHPDAIYQRTEGFRSLVSAVARANPPAPPKPPPTLSAASAPRDLLDQILEGEQPAHIPIHTGDLSDFIRKVTAPSLESREDTEQKQRKLEESAVACLVMNGILHDPAFQSLEAAWRGAEWLARRLDVESNVTIGLLDATPAEFTSDAEGLSHLLSSANWNLVVALHSFGQTAGDAAILSSLGHAASRGRATLLAEAELPAQPSAEWAELRRSPEARAIGLAMPRFLLRLPYGKDTSPIDSFAFEEMPLHEHTNYLWGNPAILCASLLSGAATTRKVDGLPLHIYKDGLESIAKPCAEVMLSESEVEFLLENGVMPVASMRDQDAAVLMRLQSIADPPTALA